MLAGIFSMPVRAQSSVYDWTGFYAGVHGGGAWGTAKGSDTPPFALFDTARQSVHGGFGGIQAGYHLQFNRAVWGFEFSGLYGNVGGTGGCFSSAPPGDIMNCKTKLDWSFQLLTRLGYAYGDGRFLPYVTGGAVLSNIATHRHYDDGILPESWGGKIATPGVGIGAGFLYALGNGYSFGVEYLYVDYFNQNISTVSSCGCDRLGEQGLATQSLRFSLNYTFAAPSFASANLAATRSDNASSNLYDWTGFYIGGHVGGERAKLSGGSVALFYSDRQQFDTGLGGIQFGYNHQFGRFVLGAELSGSWPWNGSSDICDSTGTITCHARQEWSGQFLTRLGYAMGDTGYFMPYLVGGVAISRVKLGFSDFVGRVGATSNMTGAVFGAGLQYAFGNGWSLGAEYLYTGYGSEDFSSAGGGGLSDDQNQLSTQTIRVVTNYKFGSQSSQAVQSSNTFYDWSGFYVGAHGGFENVRAKGVDLFGFPTSQKVDGANGGAQFGYNFQLGRVVFGTELSLSAGNVSGTDIIVTGPDVTSRLREEWSGKFLTRLGYAFGDGRLLPYLVGGLALTQFDIDRTLDVGVPINWGGSKLYTGVVAGLGFQYAWTEKLSLGAEYLFTQYGMQYHVTNFGPAFNAFSQKISSDAFRVVLNYKFDGASPGR